MSWLRRIFKKPQIDTSLWHKVDPHLPHRMIDGEWTIPYGQVWVRKVDGRWEYRQDEDVDDEEYQRYIW